MNALLITLCYLFIIILSVFLLCKMKLKNQNNTVFVILFVSILFGGLSILINEMHFISYDRGNYALWYTKLYPRIPLTINGIRNGYGQDIGFLILNKFLYLISDNSNFMFFVLTSLPIFSLLFFSHKLIEQPKMAYAFILTSYYPVFSTYLLRQMFALIFILIAMSCFIKQSKIKYYLFVIIASLFHFTAICMIGFPLLCKILNTRKKFILYMVISIAILPFIVNILSFLVGNIEDFAERLNSTNGTIFIIFKGAPFTLFTIYVLLKRDFNTSNNSSYIAMFTSGLCYLYSTKLYWIYRISIYLLPIGSILITDSQIKKKNIAFVSLIMINFIFSLREFFLLHSF